MWCWDCFQLVLPLHYISCCWLLALAASDACCCAVPGALAWHALPQLPVTPLTRARAVVGGPSAWCCLHCPSCQCRGAFVQRPHRQGRLAQEPLPRQRAHALALSQVDVTGLAMCSTARGETREKGEVGARNCLTNTSLEVLEGCRLPLAWTSRRVLQQKRRWWRAVTANVTVVAVLETNAVVVASATSGPHHRRCSRRLASRGGCR